MAILALWINTTDAVAQAQCSRTITANVVALDQPIFYNRLGAVNPNGMIFALERDVVVSSGGNVSLRSDKRPRPIVLRANVGDCLTINLKNMLAGAALGDQPATRAASIHIVGMSLVGSIDSDGSNVGANSSSLIGPGETKTYTYYASKEGTHLLYSGGATNGGEGDGGSLAFGLFGAVNVQPTGSEWYEGPWTWVTL